MAEITEKELNRIEYTFDNDTQDISEEIDIRDLLPLVNYAENVSLGTTKAIYWAFKLGVKHERQRVFNRL